VSYSLADLRYYHAHGYGIDLTELPTSQLSAASVGVPYFYTGRPCKNGHHAARYTKGGNCSYCTRQKNATRMGKEFNGVGRRAILNITRKKAASDGVTTYVPAYSCKNGHFLRYVVSNNCVECDKNTLLKHKRNRKIARLCKLYGFSDEISYLDFIKSHNSSCNICNTYNEDTFGFHIDHDHDTGKVRGLLCNRCNQGIGLLRDDPNLLIRAAEYLNAHA
jgi:hypothetical protein